MVVVASPGAVASVDAPGQVVVAVVSTGVVEEISPGAETVTVDHPSWSLEGGENIYMYKPPAHSLETPASSLSLLLSRLLKKN